MALAWARSGCRKAWRSAAATMLCWVFATWARALRIQCTRQRCQPAPNTRRTAALSPSWASEMTSLTLRKPRRARLLRKLDQKVSASDGPICRPTISRRPSVLAATAILGATAAVRPARALLQVSGVKPQIRPFAGERPIEKGIHALVDVFAQLGDLRLADPRQSHRLNSGC